MPEKTTPKARGYSLGMDFTRHHNVLPLAEAKDAMVDPQQDFLFVCFANGKVSREVDVLREFCCSARALCNGRNVVTVD